MIRRRGEKLHRIDNDQNDWDNLADHELNFWQKVAKKTKGIVTAANAITIGGSVLLMNGLFDIMNNQKLSGALKVGVGAGADFFDGTVAEMTGTKGRVGRNLDPFCDTIKLGASLVTLQQIDFLPLVSAVAVAVPVVVGSIGSVAAVVRGREVNVTPEGKAGAAIVWFGIGSFIAKAVFENKLPGVVDMGLELAGWGGTVGGSFNRLPAVREYMHAGFGHEPPIDTSGA